MRAPWAGLVTEVPVEVGQAAFSMAGREIAQIVALDPIVAVVEVAERKLAGIQVGEKVDIRLVTGQTATGKIRLCQSPQALRPAPIASRSRRRIPKARSRTALRLKSRSRSRRSKPRARCRVQR